MNYLSIYINFFSVCACAIMFCHYVAFVNGSRHHLIRHHHHVCSFGPLRHRRCVRQRIVLRTTAGDEFEYGHHGRCVTRRCEGALRRSERGCIRVGLSEGRREGGKAQWRNITATMTTFHLDETMVRTQQYVVRDRSSCYLLLSFCSSQQQLTIILL